MKLYTEEQVRKAIALGYDWCHQKHIPVDFMIDNFINSLTPIQLPTDEEIYNESPRYDGSEFSTAHHIGFREGVNWMRDKIKGGKDERDRSIPE